MEYSELAAAINENDTPRVNRLVTKLRSRLISYLHIHMNANKEDAEDCAQEALLASVETIKNGKLRDAEYLFSFLLTTCRNNYLNIRNKKKPQRYHQMPDEIARPPLQLKTLLSKERDHLLKKCLQKLSDDYRTFINYWFNYPGSEASAAADYFGLSEANIWTRKHRIIKKLSECYQKKSNN